MCRDRESGILVILLMVDLRVVGILGVDIILDIDELTAIGLSVIVTLAGLSYPTQSWSWAKGEVTYARGWMRMCVEFRDEIFFFKEGRM